MALTCHDYGSSVSSCCSFVDDTCASIHSGATTPSQCSTLELVGDRFGRDRCVTFGEYLLRKLSDIRTRLVPLLMSPAVEVALNARLVELEWIRKDLQARVMAVRELDACQPSESAYLMEDLRAKQGRISCVEEALLDLVDACTPLRGSPVEGKQSPTAPGLAAPPPGPSPAEGRRLLRAQRQRQREEARAQEARLEAARAAEAEADRRQEDEDAVALNRFRRDWTDQRRVREEQRLETYSYYEAEWQKLRHRVALRQREEAQEQALRQEEKVLEAERRLLRAREEQRAAERQAERLRDAAVLQGLEEADLCARDDAAHCLALREDLVQRYEAGAIAETAWQAEMAQLEEMEDARVQRQVARDAERRRLMDRELRRQEHERLMRMEGEVEAKLLEESELRRQREVQEAARRAREGEEDALAVRRLQEAETQRHAAEEAAMAAEEERLREEETRARDRQQQRAQRALQRQQDAERAQHRLQLLAAEAEADEREARADELEREADRETAEILSPHRTAQPSPMPRKPSADATPSPLISGESLSGPPMAIPAPSPFEAIPFFPPSSGNADGAIPSRRPRATSPPLTAQDYITQRMATAGGGGSPERSATYYHHAETVAVPPGPKASSPSKERKVRFMEAASPALSQKSRDAREEDTATPVHIDSRLTSRSPSKSLSRQPPSIKAWEARPTSPRSRANSLSSVAESRRSRSPNSAPRSSSRDPPRAPSVERQTHSPRDTSPTPPPQRHNYLKAGAGTHPVTGARRNTVSAGCTQKENIPARKGKAKNIVVIDMTNPDSKPTVLGCLDLAKAPPAECRSVLRIPFADCLALQNLSPRPQSARPATPASAKTVPAPRRDPHTTSGNTHTPHAAHPSSRAAAAPPPAAARDGRGAQPAGAADSARGAVPCWVRQGTAPLKAAPGARPIPVRDAGPERSAGPAARGRSPTAGDPTPGGGSKHRSLSVPLISIRAASQEHGAVHSAREPPTPAKPGSAGSGLPPPSADGLAVPLTPRGFDTSTLPSLELSPIRSGSCIGSSVTSSPRDVCDGQLVELVTPVADRRSPKAGRAALAGAPDGSRTLLAGLNALRAEVMVCTQEMGAIISRVHASPDKERIFQHAYRTIEEVLLGSLSQASEQPRPQCSIEGRWSLTPTDLQLVPPPEYPALLRALQELVIAYDMMPSAQQCTSRAVSEVAPNIPWLTAIARLCGRRH